jgi:tRNA(Leu) C34 or U34 (ribose-2'-O)-methylase TrmL
MVDIVLVDPKGLPNIGNIIRAASCLYADRVIVYGNRVTEKDFLEETRLPREFKRKDYKNIELLWSLKPLDICSGIPIAIENFTNSESLCDFEHPQDDATYVFGPEDGSIYKGFLKLCHRFISIPTLEGRSMNLATCVSITLWDRFVKSKLYVKTT